MKQKLESVQSEMTNADSKLIDMHGIGVLEGFSHQSLAQT